MRKRKVKYEGKNNRFASTFLILFGICWACFCIPCFLHGDGNAAYIVGIVLLIIGAGITVPGIIMKTKDDFKKRKKFTKNDRYAVKAYVTEVCEGNSSINGTPSQHVICKSEQTGLEYVSDDAWVDLYGCEGAKVWVYLDPDDQSEYGKYFVDLESLIN